MSRPVSAAAWLAASMLVACNVDATLGRFVLDAGGSDGGRQMDAASDDAAVTTDAAARVDAAELPLTEADHMFCDERGGGPGCGYCLGDSCCREVLQCVEDEPCDCWLTCTRTLDAADCEAECPAPTPPWQSLAACNDTRCLGACPPLR